MAFFYFGQYGLTIKSRKIFWPQEERGCFWRCGLTGPLAATVGNLSGWVESALFLSRPLSSQCIAPSTRHPQLSSAVANTKLTTEYTTNSKAANLQACLVHLFPF